MNRWWKVGCAVAGLALLLVVACSDAPSDSGGAEFGGDPVEAVRESAQEAERGPAGNLEASTVPDDRQDGTVPASTLPTTAPASEGEVTREEVSRTVTEPVEQPETASSARNGEETRVTVEDPSPDPVGAAPEVSRSRLSLASDILLSGRYRPDSDVRFDRGEIHATVVGSIGPERRLAYTVHAAEGQSLLAAVDARDGVWIDLRLGEVVIVSEEERSQRVETALPSGGSWKVSVVSTRDDFNDYALTIRVLPPPPISTRSSIEPGSVVYLTFDDGPDPRNTPHILDILARYNARATFFVVGRLVAGYPDLFQRIISEGHTVANHTWNHENLAKLSRQQFDQTIGRTQEILGDYATPCLRPPYGATRTHTRTWAAEHGLEVHMWSVSANDWEGLDGEAIADRILTRLTDGSVVLMHDGGGNRAQTVRGLEIILEELALHRLRYEPLCT